MEDITLNNLLMAEPSLAVQLVLAGIWTTIWFILIPLIAYKVLKPIKAKHPMAEQFADLWQKTMKEGLGVNLDHDAARELGYEAYAVFMQHVTGGILCIPVVLSLPQFSTPVAQAMARHGALCEVGWEIEDYLGRIFSRLFGGEAGKKKNPDSMMVLTGIHHVMGTMLVIPMNIYFPDCYWYFLLVFLLQGAAGSAIFFQCEGFFQDLSTSGGICMMKLFTLTVFLILWGARVIGYGICIYHLLPMFWDFSTGFFVVGCIAAFLMGLMNLLFTLDGTGKFLKFILYKREDTTDMPKDERVRLSRRMSYETSTSSHLAIHHGDEAPHAQKVLHKRLSGQNFAAAREPFIEVYSSS